MASRTTRRAGRRQLRWSAGHLITEGADGDRADWDTDGRPSGGGRTANALTFVADAEPPGTAGPGAGWGLYGPALDVAGGGLRDRLQEALKSLSDTPGGQIFATVDGAFWLLEPGQPATRLIGGTLAARRDDGRLLISTGAVAEIHEPSGHVIDLKSHGAEIRAVAWSRDGRAAVGAADGVVRIWSATGDLLHTLTHHLHPVTGVAWGPDGHLATADAAGALLVWDTRLSTVPATLETCALTPLDDRSRQLAGLGPAQPAILTTTLPGSP